MLANFCLTLVSPWLKKAIPNAWYMLKGQFRQESIKVDKLTKINESNVITFIYRKFYHQGIVSAIAIEDGTDNKKGKLTIIHYAWPSVLSKGKIKEETFNIDLETDNAWLVPYIGYEIYHPDEVIRRVKLRLGEEKFNILSNRSTHFCFWATTKDLNENNGFKDESHSNFVYIRPFDESKDSQLQQITIDHKMGKLSSSHWIANREVKSREEIRAGNLVEFSEGLNPYHKAICTGIEQTVEEGSSKVTLILVHYGKSNILEEEKKTFDL